MHNFLKDYTAEGLRELHPKIDSIISDTIALQLPRKLAYGPLLKVLQGCPVITARAADEATGHRYGKSTIREYAMLARIASKAIAEGAGLQAGAARSAA